jgi:branched-chain amino acid transport system permease protein
MMVDIVAIVTTTIILGSIYGLVAIGMSLIYGILRVLDMSQGSMVMVGSFVAWGVLVVANLNPLLALAAAFAVTFVLGVLTQLVSVQPLVGRGGIDFEMVTFITTFAVAMVLQNVALEIFGPRQRNVPALLSGQVTVYEGVTLPYQSIAMVAVSLSLMLGFGIFLSRSRYGLAIRAVAQDANSARLMGVPIKRLFPLTMGLASALAGIAGVFLGATFFASPRAGDLPLLEALIVVIFGGLGSLPGTVYAAYAIGFIQSTVEVTIGTTWTLPVLYAVIVAILIVRPQGLMGKRSEVRL